MNHKKAMPANGTRFSAIATAESGSIGGPIFPALFIGGTAGVAVHQIFPSVPLGLAFTCLFAAVPAFLTMEGVKYLRASRKQAHAAAAKPAAPA